MMFWNKKDKFHITYVTDSNYDNLVMQSEIPVLLDFYADWCGPCKIVESFIDELAEEYEGKALVAKVNVETNPKLSDHFKVKSIPTFIFINNGLLVERLTGLIPKPNIEEILDEYISENLNTKKK